MAGTVTYTDNAHGTQTTGPGPGMNFRRRMGEVRFTWLCTAGGAADKTTTEQFSGWFVGAWIIPDPSGTSPTVGYDVTITNADGIDLLNGAGADATYTLSATVPTYIPASATLLGATSIMPLPLVNTTLALTIANAGAAKGGKVVAVIQRA